MTRTIDSAAAVFIAVVLLASTGPASSRAESLRQADEFSDIKNKAERSAALFTEAGKVLLHPRCVNCHPAGESPLQGDADRLHEPPVVRGMGGLGVVGMQCRTCHGRDNFDPGGVPGAPQWHLAPRKMSWEGLTLSEICEQVKDPERNGGRSLDEIVEHMTEDALVGWAWAPGAGRDPVPGTQEAFGEIIKRWVKTGAVCP